jgi:hypothetical protein
MMVRLVAAMVSAILFVSAAYAQGAGTDAGSFLSEVNRNNDQTLSMKELNSYAAKKSTELNTAGHKSLSRAELGDRISDADFDAANTHHNKDQTLTRAEFVTYVDGLFREANTKGSKTLSIDELGTPAGQKLITLLH